MIMEDDDGSSVVSLPLHVVIFPVLDELQKTDLAAAQTLRAALNKVEKKHPGFTQDLVNGILKAKSADVKLAECLLRLAAYDSEEYMIMRPEPEFNKLNQQAHNLKHILSMLPDEIENRPAFLQRIKDIASGIKELLQAVNVIFKQYEAFRLNEHIRELELHKKEFIKSSKKFSYTLKGYFRDSKIDNVYDSANVLVNETNTILKMLKTVSRKVPDQQASS
ncbi:programmed cell death protein 10-like [Antedon mediterranea]|uniref:programmed cell death protein 10-like n=1 Tax=Antedon mediterranea TaxID=105859 RepID=UPI003AF8D8E4